MWFKNRVAQISNRNPIHRLFRRLFGIQKRLDNSFNDLLAKEKIDKSSFIDVMIVKLTVIAKQHSGLTRYLLGLNSLISELRLLSNEWNRLLPVNKVRGESNPGCLQGNYSDIEHVLQSKKEFIQSQPCPKRQRPYSMALSNYKEKGRAFNDTVEQLEYLQKPKVRLRNEKIQIRDPLSHRVRELTVHCEFIRPLHYEWKQYNARRQTLLSKREDWRKSEWFAYEQLQAYSFKGNDDDYKRFRETQIQSAIEFSKR